MNLLKIFLVSILLIHLSANANTLENVTLQLQWKHQFEFAGFYAAKEQGYYKDAGIDVKFLEYDGKSTISNIVLSKKADFGLTYSSLITDYLNNKDVVLVANYFKQSTPENVLNPSAYHLTLFTSKEYALKHPNVVQKFKEATNRGWRYALDNKEQIVNLILKKYNTQHKTKEALLFEVNQIEQIILPNIKKKSDFIFNKKERQWLQKNPVIKIAYLASWPKNNNGLNIHTQYLKLLRKYGNLNIFATEFASWKDAYSNVLNNNFIDGILYLSKSKEREKYFNFLPPYSFVPVNLVVKEKNHTIKSLKDLNNRSIYTLKGSISNQIIQESGFHIKTIPLATEEKLIEALANKHSKADAMLTFNYDKYKFKKNGLKVVKRIQNKYGNVHIGIAKNNPLVYSILKKAHDNIPKEQLAKIQKFQSIKQSYSFYNTLTSREKLYLSNKKSITMCVDPDWEPYEKIDKNGNYIGLAADYMQLIEKKIDKKIKLIKTKTWKESLKFAKEGKCEILSFLNKTPQREKFFNFTPIMYSEPEVIVAKDDVTYLDGISSLEHKTIGLVKGYRTDEYISKHYPKMKIKYIKNYEEGIRLVSNGTIDVTVNALLGTAYLIRKSNLSNIKIAGKTELTNNYKIGIIKDEPLLHSILTKVVSSITKKEKEKILSNWISVKFEQGYNYELFWKFLIIVIIIFLLFAHRQYTIKKINKELKEQVDKQVSQIVEKDRMIFQQNKLASMGEMIENIAHQWRQPLSQVNAAVMSIDDIAYDAGCLSEEMEKELKDIENATKYMSKTIDDFREFMSENNSEEIFKIDDVFTQCLGIISKSLAYHSIEVTTEIDKSLKVKGLSSEFLQVLMIVLNNAKEAIILNEIKKGKIVVKGYEKNSSIYLSITDNAGGIDEDIIDKIFEPYFTTKHKSQGTGLGLYISKMIIEGKFKGKLLMENRDSGACILMEFKKRKENND